MARFILLAALMSCASAQAQTAAPQTAVDLELVLAVDVSFSIDRFEARQQRDGYVAALAHPAVIAAARSGEHGRIAVTYVEWSEPGYQRQLIPWRIIDGDDSAEAFAAELAAQPMTRSYYTSISHAIAFSARLIAENAYDGARKVIDVSGDGPQNQGYPVREARDAAVAAGIVINGLPILNDRPNPVGVANPIEAGLDLYFTEQVIGGPGAFIVPAEGFDSFRAAILAKLVREIAAADDAVGLNPLSSEPAR